MSTLNEKQAVFSLAFLANANFGLDATEGTQSQTSGDTLYGNAYSKIINGLIDLNQYLPEGGNFERMWGPVIASSLSKDPKNNSNNSNDLIYTTDNLLYVAAGPSPYDPKTCLVVVATAGTNGTSYKGWFGEDFDVNLQQAWPYNPYDQSATAPLVYDGGYQAQDTLVKMVDTRMGNVGFFDGVKSAVTGCFESFDSVRIVATGHSLGGGLAPLLIMRLVAAFGDPNFFSIPAGKTLQYGCYTFAGPTPGNQGFVDVMNKALNINQGGQYYFASVNNNDAVPQAWVVKNMDRIPNLFSNAQTFPGFVRPYTNATTLPYNKMAEGMVIWAKGQLASTYEYAAYSDPANQFNGAGPDMTKMDVTVDFWGIKGTFKMGFVLNKAAQVIDNRLFGTGQLRDQLNIIHKQMTGKDITEADIFEFLIFMFLIGYEHVKGYVDNILAGFPDWQTSLHNVLKNKSNKFAFFDEMHNFLEAMTETANYLVAYPPTIEAEA